MQSKASRERVEVEACTPVTVLRKTYRGNALVRAELLHHGKRKGWRLCPYEHDREALAYKSSDNLAAYIHSRGEVGFYDAWSDGARSQRRMSREAWIEECLADMRNDAQGFARSPAPTRKGKRRKPSAQSVCGCAPTPKPEVDVLALNNQAHELIEADRLDEAAPIVARARAALEARGEIVVDKAHFANVHDWYFMLQRELQIAWKKARYAEHREDAARAYVLENAMVDLTSRFDPDDPKGPRIADDKSIYSYGLWAIVSFQTRTGHFEEAEKLFTGELANESRMLVRLRARRSQTEHALNGGLCIYVENPKREAAIARARPAFDAICKLVGTPTTGPLAHQLACFHVFYNELDAAQAMLQRAIALGAPREELDSDPDLAPLREQLIKRAGRGRLRA